MPDNDNLPTESQVTDRSHGGVSHRVAADAPSVRQKPARRRSLRNGAAMNNHLRVRFATARFLG